MSFTLGDIIGAKVQEQLKVHEECPTTKNRYATRKQAQRVAKRERRASRTPMQVFRCSYCDGYHLGHRRGSVW